MTPGPTLPGSGGSLGGELAELYVKYSPIIHRRCRSLLGDVIEADDAVQEIFVRLSRDRVRFRGDSLITTWLYRVATNHCLNAIRSRKRRARMLEELERGLSMLSPQYDGVAEDSERRNLLAALLATLDEVKVQVLVHTYYDGMTQEEIAEVLAVSDRTVRKHLSQALESLRGEGRVLSILAEATGHD